MIPGNQVRTDAARAETLRRFLKYMADLTKVKITRLEDIPIKAFEDAKARLISVKAK